MIGVPLHHGRPVPDSLGRLYVDCSSSAFIPLSHKDPCLVLGKSYALAQVPALNLGSIFALLRFASSHLITMASLFQSSTSLDVNQVV